MRLAPSLIGPVLHDHRNRHRLSQAEAARRAGVSTRLWAETERGQRPHVSVTSVLRMLEVVGVAVNTEPDGEEAAHMRASSPLSPAVLEELREDLRRAAAYGVDLSLIRAGLDLTPLERVQRNDDALAFFSSVTLEPGWPSAPAAPTAGRPSRRRSR